MIQVQVNDQILCLPAAEVSIGGLPCKIWPPESAGKIASEAQARIRAELFPEARYKGVNPNGGAKNKYKTRGVIEAKEGINYYASCKAMGE